MKGGRLRARLNFANRAACERRKEQLDFLRHMRDKVHLDIFWLKDESPEESAALPRQMSSPLRSQPTPHPPSNRLPRSRRI